MINRSIVHNRRNVKHIFKPFNRSNLFSTTNNYSDLDIEDIELNTSGESISKITKGSRQSQLKNYKFVDKVTLDVRGGRGGNGCISFEMPKPGKRIPTGGSGGRGGNVYIVADKSLFSFNFQSSHFNAGNGEHGKGDGMIGRNGKDIFVSVPVGTIVTEKPSSNEFDDFDELEEADKAIDQKDKAEPGYDDVSGFYELNEPNDILLVASGGAPGIGNKSMRGTNKSRRHSLPKTNMPGEPGQQRSIILELKLIADVGLVGFPNAGKSSLLRILSNARPKVASYAFTTLHPSIGIIDYSDHFQVSVADIPGLIDGAHKGRGLGHEFLRHIERTKVLLFVLDLAGTDGRSPSSDLISLLEELRRYDPQLLRKPCLVFGNKMDLEVSEHQMRMLRYNVRRLNLRLLVGSVNSITGIEDLAISLRKLATNTETPVESKVKQISASRGRRIAPRRKSLKRSTARH